MTDQSAPLELEAVGTVYIRPVPAAEILAQMDEEDRPAIDADSTLYAVHLEDGTRMAVFSERQAAFVAAREHGADPVSTH